MAVKDPILKRCRYLGISPMVMGINKKSNRNPGANVRHKVSEYGMQLKEKQKVKFIYGVEERQFRGYYEEAERMRGKTGDNMLSLLERRLDNVVFRLGLAQTRFACRQIVSHRQITVNGKSVDVRSYLVNVGDVIAVKESKQKKEMFSDVKSFRVIVPKWLEFDAEKLTGKVVALPKRDDIDVDIQEHLIIELYSK
ncbi:MAG: 30S ribosomal protein S4 [Clostridia bacterium]|nr:30S ribosomal protein S4 [Clostridia bacterium]